MKTFWIAITIINLSTLSAHVVRNGDLCPLVCRVDANGIRGAWYETQLPGLQKTIWISDRQKKMQAGSGA